ncbi:MAG: discoidin domain-containing protein [Acidobacteria bacterium]|nr:discoidin domain-containing protein [Acidobacteriota bacterium]
MKTSTRTVLFGLAVIPLTLLAVFAVTAQPGEDALRRGFMNPPDSAKPRVWWHWMNGNITKEGIKADLEWMKRSNIAGMQNFDAALNTPQIVEKRLVFMTPEWKDAFKYATTLADQLNLELAIAGSPGWSESGGPWVPPAQAMKKFVWSETRVEGGAPFTGKLPKPPGNTGPFQNMVGGRRGFGGAPEPTGPQPEYYADAAVVAFRIPADDRTMKELAPKVTSSGGTFDLAALTDGDLARSTLLPAAPAGERAWIQFEFAQPQLVRGLTLVTGGAAGRGGRGGAGAPAQTLEASDNGAQFRTVTAIAGGGASRTVSFSPVTARFFRVTFLTPQPMAGRGGFGGAPSQGARGNMPQQPAGTQIAELELYTGARVNRVEDKGAFTAAQNLGDSPTPAVPSADAVRKAEVVDLTARMRPDGSLDWTPPAGKWCVLRLGYSLLGITNHPATPEATGLEVDKLNKAYVKAYLDKYLDMYKDAVGPLMGKRGLRYVITDSWEAGTQNWTDDMIAEFSRRRGYDMRPWLPVLTGHVVESAEASDRFLWDFRRTIADLTAENHYDEIETELKARGMGRYSESHENGRAFIADGMEVKRTADVPMSAMWTGRGGVNGEPANYNADIRESASVAHIYGQNLVAAESLTAGSGAYTFAPENLKPTADAELAMGLNRFVIHTSVHQPVSSKMPGLSLGQFGQWFTRLETWADYAKYWMTYLGRSSYMLQQGHFAADVLYYYGEDSNITALFGNQPPDIPAGYGYDFTNSDALLHRMSARDGRIVTPSGMSYRLLVLDANARHMPLPVLRKIRDMVEAGVAVAGPKPVDSPSLSDDQAEVRRIAGQLFGDGSGEHTSGKGKVYAGQTAGQALAAMKVAPDFTYAPPRTDSLYLFVHRTLPGAEIYWVDNRKDRAETLEASFREQGKEPEIWHAETGAIEPASYRIADGRTTVSLRFDPYGAAFVVFRKPAAQTSRQLPARVETPVATVEGAWDVAFQPDRGAPAKVQLDRLVSWTDNSDPGVKYFSGTGTYTKTVQAPADWFKTGAHLWLDLGEVKNLAEVTVNGKSAGVAWHAPFRVDVTGALKPGANTVEVKVVNLWVNRIVGDLQPGQTRKYTWTAMQYYRADSPLLPSGLLGPVRVIRSQAE